jgi:hypothetical protein
MFIQQRWDMVTATEVYPQRGEHKQRNAKFLEVLSRHGLSKKQVRALYEPSDYIKLLEMLNELDNDKSWSLIMTPSSQGSTRTSQEMTAYYYKANRMTPVPNKYCQVVHQRKRSGERLRQGAIACLPEVSQSMSPYIAKIPFIASFKVNRADFTFLSTHQRATGPGDRYIKRIVRNYFSFPVPRMTKQYIGRAVELDFAIKTMEQLKRVNQDQDIMLMGDINLEIPTGNREKDEFWQNIIGPNREIWIDEPTTISRTRLTSKYDHFIVDKVATRECDSNSARVVNFTQPAVLSQILGTPFRQVPAVLAGIKESYIRELKNIVQIKTVRTGELVYPYLLRANDTQGQRNQKTQQLNTELRNYDRVISTPFGRRNYFSPGMFLLSDHLPIAITCRINRDDD